MSDTTLRDCVICGEEGDCIEGICSNCAAEDDLTHYMSATSRLSEKVQQLQAKNKRLRELLNEAQCPDILHCDNGIITDTFNNEKSRCVWCVKREQALKV